MQIVGTLSEVTLSDVARMISQVRQTGTMVVHTTPVRWVSFVAGAIDMVEREDGVLRDRVEAWRKTQDPAEQFRVRKDRLMELILLDGCRAGFEFASGDVEESGLPPFDLTELENRALLTGCPDQHTDHHTDRHTDRPAWPQHTWPQPVQQPGQQPFQQSAHQSVPHHRSLRPVLPPTEQQRATHGAPALTASVLAVPRQRDTGPTDHTVPEPVWAVPPPTAAPSAAQTAVPGAAQTAVPGPHDPGRSRQRALSRLISAVRSR